MNCFTAKYLWSEENHINYTELFILAALVKRTLFWPHLWCSSHHQWNKFMSKISLLFVILMLYLALIESKCLQNSCFFRYFIDISIKASWHMIKSLRNIIWPLCTEQFEYRTWRKAYWPQHTIFVQQLKQVMSIFIIHVRGPILIPLC